MTEKSKQSKLSKISELQGVHLSLMALALAAISAVGYWGNRLKTEQHEQWAQYEALVPGKLVALRVPSEVLSLAMSDVRVIGGTAMTNAKHPQPYRYWTGLQSKEWMILNGGRAQYTCPLMGEFTRHNDTSPLPLTPEALDMVVSALDGYTVPVAVFVPRFTGAPDSVILRSCPGFHYDAATKTLKVGARTVAVLATTQPGLLSSEGATLAVERKSAK